MLRRTRLKKKSDSPTAKCKERIQALCRAIGIKRDGGCILNPYQGQDGIPQCNGYRKDGELILQYDHLNSRAHNVSYADTRLGVILCKGHHGWKSFTDNNKKKYDILVRTIIGPDRTALWDKVEKDTKTYPMGLFDWTKQEWALDQELSTYGDLTDTERSL